MELAIDDLDRWYLVRWMIQIDCRYCTFKAIAPMDGLIFWGIFFRPASGFWYFFCLKKKREVPQNIHYLKFPFVQKFFNDGHPGIRHRKGRTVTSIAITTTSHLSGRHFLRWPHIQEELNFTSSTTGSLTFSHGTSYCYNDTGFLIWDSVCVIGIGLSFYHRFHFCHNHHLCKYI